jgi:hypothetical protein
MGEEEIRYLYFDIPKQERDSAIAFLLNTLLKSRTACQLPSNENSFDEDVNIYLAHLLFAASLPDYQEAVRRYLSTNVSEMTELVEKNDDRIVRYFIYKVNADHLMIHLGVFHDLEASRHLFAKSEKQYVSMARDYYSQAADYNRRIYRRQTAIGSVLEKLAYDFNRYQAVLHFARKEFFHFASRFRDESFQKFCDDVKQYEDQEKFNRAIDQFLDSYAEWIRTKNANARFKLIDCARKLQAIKPEFTFNFSAEGGSASGGEEKAA